MVFRLTGDDTQIYLTKDRGTIFADDKLAAAIIDRIVRHGRLLEFTGRSRRVSEALMFGRTPAGTASGSKEKTKEQAGTLLD